MSLKPAQSHGCLQPRAGSAPGDSLDRMPRRVFLKRSLLGLVAVSLRPAPARSQPGPSKLRIDSGQDVLAAPSAPELWPAWRTELARWREEVRAQLGYADALYRRPEFAWTQSCFSCGFVMMNDVRFCDPNTARYRVAAFLDESEREFGGFDAVVLWHAYPRIGTDDRNQFDFYRDMPGGLAGLRRLARACRARGTRVFVDYNPWDRGTRREGRDDLDALAELVGAIEADGIFLDTMNRGASAFREKLDAVRPGVVLEGEIALPLENLHDHHLSWAQWFTDSPAPGVLRNKWFERRHLQHQIKRWDLDHTGELHAAWMNGSGMMVWENVFGSWIGWNERDRAILRTMLPIQRAFARTFTGEHWTPLVPTQAPDVFASLWESPGLRLWTLVNRSHRPIHGPLLQVSTVTGERHFDMVAGRGIHPEIAGTSWVLEGELAPRGIGCFLGVSRERAPKGLAALLRTQRRLRAGDRAPRQPAPVVTQLRPPPRTEPREQPPDGMVAIPAATVELASQVRVRECGFYTSVPPPDHRLGSSYEYQLETFRRTVTLSAYAIDIAPVTNAEFGRFCAATGYRPRHRRHFLRHWPGGRLPAGFEDHPVVYVDLEDARAYARWVGKRLPTEEEWQYAAQGPAALRYPWGNTFEPGRCNDGATGGTTPVRAFPSGRTPSGIYDLCGNTWEWTESERSDGRTRFAMLKGGSFYRATGSGWYFDGGPQPNAYAAKFLLMWPGLDRCATIGFRCVMNLSGTASAI